MASRKKTRSAVAISRKSASPPQEMDSVYILKLVMYLIIGTQWIHITRGSMSFPIPIGLMIGIIFAWHDHFQIDRKVEYALLLVAAFVSFWVPFGLEIHL